MIAQHIDYPLTSKLPLRPHSPFPSQVNIPRQHHHIRVRVLDFGGPELQVEIAEDVQAHGDMANRRAAVLEVKTCAGEVSRTKVFRPSTLDFRPSTKLESRAGVGLPTRRDGFANRRLNCSAN